MEKREKSEEIQSRREFFKSMAKKSLPILGAVALMNVPVISQATASPTICVGDCTGTCTSCDGGCRGCDNTCVGTCDKGCRGTCEGSCTAVNAGF